MKRRQFLATAGACTVVGVAGCSDGGSGGTDSSVDTSGPEAVVRSYYDIRYGFEAGMSPDDRLQAIDPVLHSEAFMRDGLEVEGASELQTDTPTLTSLETEIRNENLNAEELEASGLITILELDEETIESIAGENAVVRANASFEDTMARERDHLTATEDGEWQFLR